MGVVMPQRMMELAQATSPEDFKAKTMAVLAKPLQGFKVGGSEVLFATYVEPEKTKSGIYIPNKSVQESLFQGTVGMVLAAGPMAFKYDRYGYKWEGITPKVGDWIVVRFADCWEIHLAGVSCRVVDHESIRAVISTPEIITSEKR